MVSLSNHEPGLRNPALALRRFEHQPHVLARHGETEAGRHIAGRHLGAAHLERAKQRQKCLETRYCVLLRNLPGEVCLHVRNH